jgi:hypothetical protein
MKKRLLSMILALSMMLTILPVNAITAWAENGKTIQSGNCGNNVTYDLTQNNDDTTNPTYTLTIKGNGEMADFKESDMEGRAPWIAQKEKITAVTIENGVTYVGAYAFDHCKKLTQITIHAQLNSIGKGAFRDCEGLTSIEIPKTVTSIGASAFSGCKGLSNIEIPETVVSIGGAAFDGCTGLTSIKIPATVTSIKEYTFNECSNLKNVEIPQGVVSIGECAFSECGILESIKIPQNVTSIGEYAFFGCKTLTSIEIPAKVTSISKGILSQCSNLKDVEILGAVTSIGDNAFMSCGNLTDIKIPDTVTSIGKNAFYMSGLTSIKIPNTVTSIGENAFYQCSSLAKIEMPANMPSISQDAFYRTTTTVDETRVFYYPGYRHDWDQQVSKISVNGNTDLLANDYERVHYYCDVIFNSNGGTFTDVTDGSNTKTIKKVWRKEHLTQEQINSVGKPTKDGKMFIGWNTTQDATTVIDPKSDYIADDKIYYAVYKDAVPAAVTITGLDGTTVKAGEAKNFTVSVTPNDDTINKVTFDTTSGEVQWSSDGGNTWTTVSGDVDYSELTGKKFRVVPAADAENGNVTVTVTAKKADGTEIAKTASFIVTAREHATVKINELNGKTIKQNKPYTFTVTVTAHDDSGETTLKFDNVAGLTYNNATVTDAGVTVTLTKNQSETLNFTLTPSEAGNKILKATLSPSGAMDTATYTVSEYEHAKVTIDGLDTDLKQGESKDFTVKVDPKDDSGNAIIDFGDKNSEIQYKDGEDWKSMPSGGLKINLSNGEMTRDFRITPKNDGSQTLTATVKQNDNELGMVEQTYTVAKKNEPTTPGGGENPGGGSTGDSGNTKPTPKPDEKSDRKIKIDGGIVEVNGKEVKPDEDGNITVKKGDEITVTVDKSKISDAQVFDQWVIKPDSVLNEVDPKSEKISFTMPAEDVTIEAMTRDASIEDDGPGILGTGALIATGVVGSAALLYQGHMLGTELYLRYLLPHGAVIPQNRAELAVLLWQDAENPEPVSTTLYSDISDEDSAIQQAARWAVENDLMEQLDAEEHPDHFDPFVPVTFSDSIRAWKKAQELKK